MASTRWDQRKTAIRVTAQSKTKKAVKAQVRIFPALLGIFKISWAIMGYRFFTQKMPKKPQNTEYTRQIRPLMLKGIWL